MNTVDGYAMSSWERGYGDFEMVPDLETLRLMPWNEGTALCLADLRWGDGSPVVASPRQILRAQLERLAERGLEAFAGTELEFIVFKDTYEEAFEKGYRGLKPANHYNVDYSLLGGSRVEPLLRRIRNHMGAARAWRSRAPRASATTASTRSTSTTARRCGPPTSTRSTRPARRRSPRQEGMAITFMAKYDAARGRRRATSTSRCGATAARCSPHDEALFERFVAGQLACLRELTLFYAPNVNSYKRFAKGSFAPTAVAWGRDNRTCAVRVVGHGDALRLELRVPGADVNPYLALAAMIAAGLHGLDAELELEPALEGNAYTADKPHVPATLDEARDLFAGSDGGARAPSARRSSTTTSTTPASSSRPSRPSSPTGSAVRGFERL